MRVHVKLLLPLREIVGRESVLLDIQEGHVKAALDRLSADYPRLRSEIFDESGDLNPYINILVNDAPISAQDVLKTRLRDEDRLLVFMPVSGG